MTALNYQVIITIRVDGAEFDGEALGPEIAQILRDTANDVEGSVRSQLNNSTQAVYDNTGQQIGTIQVGDVLSDEPDPFPNSDHLDIIAHPATPSTHEGTP